MLDLVKSQLEHTIDLSSWTVDLGGLGVPRLRAQAVPEKKKEDAAILPHGVLEPGA